MKRRAKACGATMRRRRLVIWTDQNKLCCWCRKYVPFEHSTIEHLKPRALGGLDSYINLAVACSKCNHVRKNNYSTHRFQLARVAELLADAKARFERIQERERGKLRAHDVRRRRPSQLPNAGASPAE